MQRQSDFAALGAAPMPRGDRQFLRDGDYDAEIIKVKKRISTNPTRVGSLMFIIELAITKVLVAKAYTTPGEGREEKSNDRGDLCTHVIKLSWPNAFSSIKGFLKAAMQLSGSEALDLDTKAGAWPEIADRAVFDDEDEQPEGFESDPWTPQPLVGCPVRVRARTVKQKNNPHLDFTVIEYFAAEGTEDAEAVPEVHADPSSEEIPF